MACKRIGLTPIFDLYTRHDEKPIVLPSTAQLIIEMIKLRVALIFFLTTAISSAARPNIVFILADDLGIGDTKIYGGDRCLIDTPHIDQLAKGGLRFTDAHVSASLCRPSRLAIISGRYPWRNQQYQRGGDLGMMGLMINPSESYTLGDLFQNAGYKTEYIGKWHLGTLMTAKFRERPMWITQSLLRSVRLSLVLITASF